MVSAVGDEPNTAWLQDSGLLTGGRLLADSRGRVGPGIVAAGDVVAFPSAGGHGRVPLWTSAIEQAKTAALGLLQGDDAPELSFQPYFWTEGFGLSLKAVGSTPLDGAAGLPRDRSRGVFGADALGAAGRLRNSGGSQLPHPGSAPASPGHYRRRSTRLPAN